MNDHVVCPIWGTPATQTRQPGHEGRGINSPRVGGEYFVAGTAEAGLRNLDDRQKVKLTTWLIEQRQLGNLCPEISSTTVRDVGLRIERDVSDRADSVLRYLAQRSETLGTQITYRIYRDLYDNATLDDFEKIYCELLSYSGCVGRRDFVFLLTHLKDRGLIEFDGVNSWEQTCTLTVEGYARLAELETIRTPSYKAFIAMWFDDSMNDAWDDGIAPAVRDAGYEPVRIDRVEHVNKIDDEIIAEIRRARFVVADFTQDDTGARGGVYYEAGFAHGLDIPVIFTCHKGSFRHVHFDTQQYNHIVWETPEELRDRLTKRIAAVLGDGPLRPADRAAG